MTEKLPDTKEHAHTKMPTAKSIKAKTDKAREKQADELRPEVIRAIEEAAAQGEDSVTLDKPLPEPLLDELEELGYQTEEDLGEDCETVVSTRISWDHIVSTK